MKAWFKKNWKLLIFCCLIASLFMYPVFKDAVLILWGDDIVFHISRIEGLAQSIQMGDWFPKIYPLKSSYFGYAWPMFYCDIFLILPAVLYNFGVPILVAYAIYCWFCIFFSAFFMFRCVEEFSSNKTAPWIGSVIYVFSNYLMLDYFLRNSMGENTAFVFLPCVLLGAHRLTHSDDMKIGYVIVAFTGLLLCHNVSFIYGCILFALTLLIYIKQFFRNKKRILYLFAAVLVTIGLTAYFLFPMLETMSKVSVLNFNIGHYGQYQDSSVPFFHYLKILPVVSWRSSLRRTTIGPVLILVPIIGTLYHLVRKKNISLELSCFTLFGLIFFFMQSSFFDLKIMSFGQFKWRILGIATVVMVLPASIYLSNLFELIKEAKVKKAVTAICITAYSLVWMYPAFEYVSIDQNKKDISAYSWYDVVNKDDGPEVCGFFDNIHYDKDIDYLFLPTIWDADYCGFGCVENTAGEIISCDLIRSNGVTSLITTQPINNEFIDFPVIYYPGIVAVLEDSEGNTTQTATQQDYNNGYTKVYIGDSAFSGKISVFYQGTRIKKISYLVSLISFIGVILYLCYRKWKSLKKG